MISVAGLNLLSRLDDVRIFRYGALGLMAIMAFLLLPIGGRRSKMPVGCLVTFTAMVAGTLLMLLDPFHSADMPVYLVTLAIMAGVVWECLDLLQLYNKSCSNPLPQFESHQGGELL